MYKLKNRKKISVFFSIFLVLVGLIGCGEGDKISVSCAPLPKNLTVNEYAKYSFTHKSIEKIVSATITSENENIFFIELDTDGQKNEYKKHKKCNDTQEKVDGYKLSYEEEFIVQGGSYFGMNTVSEIGQALPAIEDGIDCEEDFLTLGVGNFHVNKCVSITDDNHTKIEKMTTFTILNEAEKKPFYGLLRKVIDLKDGSIIIAELIEWNNL